MDFKNVVTYGRLKNRVISPQVQGNRLFASTSSESEYEIDLVQYQHQFKSTQIVDKSPIKDLYFPRLNVRSIDL